MNNFGRKLNSLINNVVILSTLIGLLIIMNPIVEGTAPGL
jgi:hypothetical protein